MGVFFLSLFAIVMRICCLAFSGPLPGLTWAKFLDDVSPCLIVENGVEIFMHFLVTNTPNLAYEPIES